MSPIPIQDAEVSTGISEAFGLKGKVSLSHDEVIVGVSIVKDLRSPGVVLNPALNPAIPRQAVGGINGNVSVALDVAYVGLNNPADSGMVCTVLRNELYVDPAQTDPTVVPCLKLYGAGDLLPVVLIGSNRGWRDARADAVPLCQPFNSNETPAVTVPIRSYYEARPLIVVDQEPALVDEFPYVILPGQQLVWRDELPIVANVRMTALFWWTEAAPTVAST